MKEVWTNLTEVWLVTTAAKNGSAHLFVHLGLAPNQVASGGSSHPVLGNVLCSCLSVFSAKGLFLQPLSWRSICCLADVGIQCCHVTGFAGRVLTSPAKDVVHGFVQHTAGGSHSPTSSEETRPGFWPLLEVPSGCPLAVGWKCLSTVTLTALLPAV